MQDYYTGTAYIGIVGPDTIPVDAVTSIYGIARRPGDAIPRFIQATKGFEARQYHVNDFLASKHDWLLLLDHDMIFEPDTLERLRSYGRPYVTGYYLRRKLPPWVSVWFEPFDGRFPMMPYTAIPPKGELVQLGGCGWGCTLVHREVFETMRPLLNGEHWVLEDDMNVWPDTGEPFHKVGGNIGSDVRFALFAKRAGYTLWGSSDITPAHIVNYPLHIQDMLNVPESTRNQWGERVRAEVEAARNGGTQ